VKKGLLLAAWAVGFLAIVSASAQVVQGREMVTARLVSEVVAIEPGRPFTVGILLEMAEGWHSYWENGGDAGAATQVEWGLPAGFSAGAIQWPLPWRFIEPGDIHAFGYKGQVLLMATITPPAHIEEKSLTLRAKVSWLVCEKICVPGFADLEMTLPVGTSAPDMAHAPLFAKFRAALPEETPPPFPLTWQTAPDAVTLTAENVPPETTLDFLTLTPEGVNVRAVRSAETVTLTIPTSIPVHGLLLAKNGERKGWIIASPGAETLQNSSSASAPAATAPTPPAAGIATQTSLLTALLYGFLGGLILNLMPCVLPVISLKIFGFIRQAGESPRKIFLHGLAFAAGIFAWFLALAVVVIFIQSAGGRATWAFQFQNPWFNLAISAVVFVFALNLFGVFEIVLPGRAALAMDSAGSGSGYGASFFQGVFATLLATPCTAPFLGAALGFAFSQTPAMILVMFGTVAFGMALPYLLLSAQPGWLKWVPRPGAWMERLKQFMAFPLLATLLWLLSILGSQKGAEAVIWAGAFLLCLWLACWIYGAFCGPASSVRARSLGLVAALLIAGLGTWGFAGVQFGQATVTATSGARSTASSDGIPWVPFTRAALDDLLKDKRAVFLDFTAEWCITCKFNKKTAIDRPAVREAIARTGIVPMLADWTNANPEITDALAQFGRVGVPFYVLYPEGNPQAPLILPEVLTEQILLDAIHQATGKD